jgi:hypothetical protein
MVPLHKRVTPHWEPSWEPFAVDWYGRLWTAMDMEAIRFGRCGRLWTAVDACGHGWEIYGSEGWGFESLRAG